jgi:trans-L-3-hydroxyproline dehydratase
VFADGEIDRSPTGTGVSGRLAIHHARGELGIGEEIAVESILGSVFTGRVAETTEIDGLPAVIPEVTGTAHITGRNELWLDPSDPLGGGFFIR